MSNTFYQAFDSYCREHAERTAVVSKETNLLYRHFLERVDQQAEALSAADIKSGQLVGLCLKNSIDYLVNLYALFKVQAVPVLIDHSFAAPECKYLMTEVGLNHCITDSNPYFLQAPGKHQMLGTLKCLSQTKICAQAPKPQANTAFCRLSSGTTGKPKVMEFTAEAGIAAAKNWAVSTGLTSDDKILCLAAFSNGLAFNTSLMSCFSVGATLFLHEGMLIPSFIAKRIDDQKITRLVAFPAFYKLLSESATARTHPSINVAISSGASCDSAIIKNTKTQCGINILSYYGIAEAGPITFPTSDTTPPSLGFAVKGTQFKSTQQNDANVLLVKSESMMSCYLNFPGLFESALTEDGFFNTGDCCQIKKSGELFITGRLKNVVKVGGKAVDLTEVTEAAKKLEGVSNAIALSEPFEHDEIIHLVLESTKTQERLPVIKQLKQHLSDFKLPRKISSLPSFPQNGIGKLRIADIRRKIHAD